MSSCNSTLESEGINETPLWNGGLIFHHLGLIISAVFGMISLVVAFYLIFMHATHYSRPWEQRHIIRILLMIPIYSMVSFLSYYYYRHAIYFEVLRDCYEAFAIASFFTLLCNYIAPNLHDQKVYFRSLVPVNWFWGVFGLQKCTGGKDKGFLRRPRSGLTWFNVIWVGVFQYCFIRVLFTVVSVITEAINRYCSESLNPAFAHIWVMVFEGASVSIAMFCLIQFYIQLKDDLREYKPLLKIICIKLVIFFSFWQTLVISFLSSSVGPLQPSAKIGYQDIQVGLPSMLLCIEMSIFAVMHVFAFPWKIYDVKKFANNPLTAPGQGYSGSGPKYHGGPFGLKAMLDAFNPWDIVKASARGFRWLFVGRKHRFDDDSYKPTANNSISSASGGKPMVASGLNPTDYNNPPAYSNNNDRGTELQSGGAMRRDRADTHATVEDDTAGLLSNAAGAHSPNRPSADARSYDERDYARQNNPTEQRPEVPMPSAYGGFDHVSRRDEEDTEYHGRNIESPPIGAAYGGLPAEWDHWGGTRRDQV